MNISLTGTAEIKGETSNSLQDAPLSRAVSHEVLKQSETRGTLIAVQMERHPHGRTEMKDKQPDNVKNNETGKEDNLKEASTTVITGIGVRTFKPTTASSFAFKEDTFAMNGTIKNGESQTTSQNRIENNVEVLTLNATTERGKATNTCKDEQECKNDARNITFTEENFESYSVTKKNLENREEVQTTTPENRAYSSNLQELIENKDGNTPSNIWQTTLVTILPGNVSKPNPTGPEQKQNYTPLYQMPVNNTGNFTEKKIFVELVDTRSENLKTTDKKQQDSQEVHIKVSSIQAGHEDQVHFKLSRGTEHQNYSLGQDAKDQLPFASTTERASKGNNVSMPLPTSLKPMKNVEQTDHKNMMPEQLTTLKESMAATGNLPATNASAGHNVMNTFTNSNKGNEEVTITPMVLTPENLTNLQAIIGGTAPSKLSRETEQAWSRSTVSNLSLPSATIAAEGNYTKTVDFVKYLTAKVGEGNNEEIVGPTPLNSNKYGQSVTEDLPQFRLATGDPLGLGSYLLANGSNILVNTSAGLQNIGFYQDSKIKNKDLILLEAVKFNNKTTYVTNNNNKSLNNITEKYSVVENTTSQYIEKDEGRIRNDSIKPLAENHQQMQSNSPKEFKSSLYIFFLTFYIAVKILI